MNKGKELLFCGTCFRKAEIRDIIPIPVEIRGLL